jgi:hypothetical protein
LMGVREVGGKVTASPLVHAYFKLASVLGSEAFYVVFLPLVIWKVCVCVRMFACVWVYMCACVTCDSCVNRDLRPQYT